MQYDIEIIQESNGQMAVTMGIDDFTALCQEGINQNTVVFEGLMGALEDIYEKQAN